MKYAAAFLIASTAIASAQTQTDFKANTPISSSGVNSAFGSKLDLSGLGQANGPAKLGADGSVAGGIYAGNNGDPRLPASVVRLDGGGGTTTNAYAAGGMSIVRNTWGNWNNAGVLSVIANNPGGPAQWSGFGTPPGLAVYPTIDSGAIYSEITSLPPTDTDTNVTFDATHVYLSVPLTSAQLAVLRPGMFIETNHSPSFKGQITAIDPAGANLTVANGWFQFGNQALGQNPQTVGTAPYTAFINIISAIWAHNAQIFLPSTGYAHQAMADEVDFTIGKPVTPASVFGTFSDKPSVLGVNMSCSANCGTGYVAKGAGWLRGFVSMGGSQAGFIYQPALGVSGVAFLSDQLAGNILQHVMPSNGLAQDVLVAAGGAVQLGSTSGTTTTPFIDFHSSAHAANDIRLIPSGGTGASDGTLTIMGKLLSLPMQVTITPTIATGTAFAVQPNGVTALAIDSAGTSSFSGQVKANAGLTGTTAVLSGTAQIQGHLIGSGGAFPSASVGTLNASSSDTRGSVALAAGSLATTITFATGFTAIPFCIATGNLTTAVPAITNVNASVMTITLPSNAAGETAYWHCIQ